MATTDSASNASGFASSVSTSNAATSVTNASSGEEERELEEELHVPEYEQFKNAILARNKAKFDA
jgi:alkaline phosphatase